MDNKEAKPDGDPEEASTTPSENKVERSRGLASIDIWEDHDDVSVPRGDGEDDAAKMDLKELEKTDYVLVWDEGVKEAKTQAAYDKRLIFESNLEKEGLILHRLSYKAKHLHFVLIQAPSEVVRRYAEILRIQVPLKKMPGVGVTRNSNMHTFPQMSTLGRLFEYDQSAFPEEYNRITAAFDNKKEYMFDIDESSSSSYFSDALRSRIVNFILKRKHFKPDDDVDVLAFGYERLVTNKVYDAAYPLHDGDHKDTKCQRGLLYKHWAGFRNIFKTQPLDAIKGYFGVKIGIYFAFLGLYTNMLIFPSIVGLIAFVYGAISSQTDTYVNDVCSSDFDMCPLCDTGCNYWKLNSLCLYARIAQLFDNASTPFFSIVMALWTAVFLELWKRREAELNHHWGLNDYEAKDQMPRPEYVAKVKNSKIKRYNFITNTVEPAPEFWSMKLPFTLVSMSSMMFLLCVAVAASVGIIVYRVSLVFFVNRNPDWLLVINFSASVLNLIFITVLGMIYQPVAKKLTEIELPRTVSDYEASYSFKLYIFHFINNYSSLFYIAYFKGNLVGHPASYNKWFGLYRQEECRFSCMSELSIQLTVFMCGVQVVNAIFEWGFAYGSRLYARLKLRMKGTKVKKDAPEHNIVRDYKLLDYDGDSLIEEYMEIAIQYGFMVIFGPAFPLAPLFALINNAFEIRTDAQKLLKYHRRPVALRIKGIGIWYTILETVSYVAVLSNGFILAITSNFIPELAYGLKHGGIKGFLNHTLTQYHIDDLQTKPPKMDNNTNVSFCSYPSYRFDFDHQRKYEFNEDHWKVWLLRIIFIVAFENIVALSFIVMRWIIPDVPEQLQKEIEREEHLKNELMIEQELYRSRGIREIARCFRLPSISDLEGVENIEQLQALTDQGKKIGVAFIVGKNKGKKSRQSTYGRDSQVLDRFLKRFV